MNVKLVVTLFLTAAGCSYQVIDIANRYFSYQTKKYVSVKIVDGIHLPSTSICWPMNFVLKSAIERLDLKTDPSKFGATKLYKMLETSTVEDVFKLIPPKSDILNTDPGCAVRLPGEMSWRHPWYNQSECFEIFTIKTYIHRLNVCYKFEPKPKIGRLSLRLNTMTPSKPGFIYLLIFNPDLFKNMSAFTAYGHTTSSSPLYDSVFSIEKEIRFNGGGYRIGVVTSPVSVMTLPAPYDTSCRQMANFASGTEYLLDQLNEETIRTMGHVHSMNHVIKEYKYPMLTPYDWRNKTTNKIFMNLYVKASKKNFRSCYFKYNIPLTRLESDVRITVAVNWSQDNELVTRTVPDQQFIDFLIYVCSSLGIWLGLSVYSVLEILFDRFHPFCGFKCRHEKRKIVLNACKHDVSVMRLNNQFLMLYQKLDKSNVSQMKLINRCDTYEMENYLLRKEFEKFVRIFESKKE